MGLFQKRRSSIGMSVLWGVSGLVVGAGIVAALTPFSGPQLRKLMTELIGKTGIGKGHDGVDSQLDNMENEGGVSHEVAPPLSTKSFETHS